MLRSSLVFLAACCVLLALSGCRREAPDAGAGPNVAQRAYRPGEAVAFEQARVALLSAQLDGQRLTVRMRVDALRDVSVRQQYDFELRGGAGRFGTPALLGVPEPPFDGRVAQGKHLEGHLGFDLPLDLTDLGAMELVYRATFAPDQKVTFLLR